MFCSLYLKTSNQLRLPKILTILSPVGPLQKIDKKGINNKSSKVELLYSWKDNKNFKKQHKLNQSPNISIPSPPKNFYAHSANYLERGQRSNCQPLEPLPFN